MGAVQYLSSSLCFHFRASLLYTNEQTAILGEDWQTIHIWDVLLQNPGYLGRLRETQRNPRERIPKLVLWAGYRSHSRGMAHRGKGALEDRDQASSYFNYSHGSLIYALGGC